MNLHILLRRFPLMRGLLIALFAAMPLGCGEGGSATTNIRLTAAERPDIAPGTATARTLRIPSETPFNYPKFTSGQEGNQARGNAVADGATGATCSAELTGEGRAWGAFQLGYGFDHQSSRESKCVVRVKLMAEESADVTAPTTSDAATTRPTGAVSLVFLLKDANGVTIKEESLVANNLRKGPNKASITHDFSFDATLLPEHGYYLVLSGRCETTSTAADSSARLRLDVSNIAIELSWAPGSTATNSETP